MQQPALQIRMLGEFSIQWGQAVVVSGQSRRSKALQLLQYLLANRGQMIPQEELIRLLLEDEDCTNPLNTLKNIVYRARKLFLEAGLTQEAYILAKGGAYGFNPGVVCVIDTEAFSACLEEAETADPEQRYQALRRAMDVYGGDYLPREVGTPWVEAASIGYQNQYKACVQAAYQYLMDQQSYEQALLVASQAIALYPYLEDFRLLRMTCLYACNRTKEAILEYNMVSNMLLDELGIVPSRPLRDLYQRMLSASDREVKSLDEVLHDLRHDMAQEPGAYYCDYLMFTNTLHILLRRMERTGESAYLVLVRLQAASGGQLSVERCKTAVQCFHRAAQRALRRSDFYTRVSSSQFLVLLTSLTYENCRLVVDRMNRAFKDIPESFGAHLQAEAVSAAQCLPPPPEPDYTWSE